MRVEKSSSRAARAARARRPPPSPARRFAAASAAGAPAVRPKAARTRRIAGDRSQSRSRSRLGAAPAVDLRRHRRPPAAAVDITSTDQVLCMLVQSLLRPQIDHALRLALRAFDGSGRDHAHLRRHADIGLDQVLGRAPASSAALSVPATRRASRPARRARRARLRAGPPARSAAQAAPRSHSAASIWVGNTLTPRMISMSSLRPWMRSMPAHGARRARQQPRQVARAIADDRHAPPWSAWSAPVRRSRRRQRACRSPDR